MPPPPPPPPTPKECPGPGWLKAESSTEVGCCTLLGADLNRTTCKSSLSPEACAKAQCTGSSKPIHVWRPEDYNHHPYTCCTHEEN